MIRKQVEPVFIDLKQAFDKVSVERIISGMKEKGVGALERRLVRMMYTNTEASIIVNGKRSKSFKKDNGLMQGGLWSPNLFNSFIDSLPEKLGHNQQQLQQQEKQFQQRQLSIPPILMFADDIVLIPEGKPVSVAEKQGMFDCVGDWAEKRGMSINTKKSAALLTRTGEACNLMAKNGTLMEGRETYSYLGFPISKSGIQFEGLVRNGRKKGRGILLTILEGSRRWPQWIKRHVFISFVRPTWEYGAALVDAVWKGGQVKGLNLEMEKLKELQDDCVRWIFGWEIEDGKGKSKRNTGNVTLLYHTLGLETIDERFSFLRSTFEKHVTMIKGTGTPLGDAWPSFGTFPPLERSLTTRLQHSTDTAEYERSKAAWRSTGVWRTEGLILTARPEMVVEGGVRWAGLDKKEFLRRRMVQQRRKLLKTSRYVMPRSRKNKTGPDKIIFIRSQIIRKLLLQWRWNRISFRRKRCEGQKQTGIHLISRKCGSRCGLLQNHPLIEERHWEGWRQEKQNYALEWGLLDASETDGYTIVDYLINEGLYSASVASIYSMIQGRIVESVEEAVDGLRRKWKMDAG